MALQKKNCVHDSKPIKRGRLEQREICNQPGESEGKRSGDKRILTGRRNRPLWASMKPERA